MKRSSKPTEIKPRRTEMVIARVTFEQKRRIAEAAEVLDITEAQFVRHAVRAALDARQVAA